MAIENINYAAILADMKTKRSALDASISALEVALGAGALGQTSGDAISLTDSVSASLGSAPVELPVGAFLGKSLKAAIKLYLSAVKKKQTVTEIAAALKAGGVESTSLKFESVVKSSLANLKADGDVLRFKDGWALAEYYNQSIRKHLADNGKTNGKRTAKKAHKKKPPKASKRVAVETEPVSAPRMESSQVGAQSTIEGYYATHAGRELSAQEVANALGLRVQTVGLICAKLAHAGKLEKTLAGNFRMAKAQQMQKAG